MTGVNKATSNASRIKVGDNGSEITLNLTNVEGAKIATVEYVRLTQDYASYVDVPDHYVTESGLHVSFPDMPKGEYKLEVKDGFGRIYPADKPVVVEIIESTEGGKQTVFVDYREEIIGELPAIVSDHMTANAELYKGAQGDPGDTVSSPPKTYTRAEYDALSTYDDNTLYIVKEA